MTDYAAPTPPDAAIDEAVREVRARLGGVERQAAEMHQRADELRSTINLLEGMAERYRQHQPKVQE